MIAIPCASDCRRRDWIFKTTSHREHIHSYTDTEYRHTFDWPNCDLQACTLLAEKKDKENCKTTFITNEATYSSFGWHATTVSLYLMSGCKQKINVLRIADFTSLQQHRTQRNGSSICLILRKTNWKIVSLVYGNLLYQSFTRLCVCVRRVMMRR